MHQTLSTASHHHLSHKKWKAHLKKLKRKEKRITAARERDKLKENGVEQDADPTDSTEEERLQQEEELERQRQNQLWLEREERAQMEFAAKKEREEKERKKKEETERKIREEWEAREKKEREEREEADKKESEKRLKQDKLLKEATANENKNAWHNPIAPVRYGKEREVEPCPFFKKTAACRFGDQCSRHHEYPEISTTLLIPSMFSSFELEQSIVDNFDTDVSLEYDENELYQSFKEFYEDVVPEFKSVGTLVQFKVCCNCEPHLRGNVYVQYKRESAAQEAFQKFNGRWYGGRQLSCIFVHIESWKAAICGLAFKNRCPKGKSCNFLHAFQNPHREFSWLEPNQQFSGRYEQNYDKSRHRYHRADSKTNHGQRKSSYYRHRSRSISPRRDSRSQSRISSRSNHQRSRSRSPGRISSRPKHVRSRSRSHSRDRNSRSRSRSQSRVTKSRSRSRSPSLSRQSRHSSKVSNKTSRDGKRVKTSRSRHHRSRDRRFSKDKRLHCSRSRSRSQESDCRTKNSNSSHEKNISPTEKRQSVEEEMPSRQHSSPSERNQKCKPTSQRPCETDGNQSKPSIRKNRKGCKLKNGSRKSKFISSSSDEEEYIYVEKTKENVSTKT